MIAQQEPIAWTGAFVLMFAIGALLIGAGLLVMSIAKRGADGSLGANGFAGIRTRATMASPEAWNAAQLAGLRHSMRAGWTLIATALVAPFIGWLVGRPDDPDLAVVWWSVVLLVGTAVVVSLMVIAVMRGQAAAKAAIATNS